MERLGDDAKRLLAASGAADVGTLGAIVAVWPAAVGPAIERTAWPRRLARDRTLHVATASSAWAFELTRLGPEILERLQSRLGEDAPAALRFAPGPLPGAAAEVEGAGSRAPQVMPEDRARGELLASPIGDEELRRLVARAASASLARARSDHRFC